MNAADRTVTNAAAGGSGGRVDSIEIGRGFVVVAGRIWGQDAAGTPDAVLDLGGTHHAIEGLFEPEGGDALGQRGFRMDLPRPPHEVDRISLRLAGETVFSQPIRELLPQSFQPQGAIDRVEDRISGWIFDPWLWTGDAGRVAELRIGGHALPLRLTLPRRDLPYSRAALGAPLGFEADLSEALAAEIDQAHIDLTGKPGPVPAALASQGFVLDRTEIDLAALFERRATRKRQAPPRPSRIDGFVEFFGYSETLRGWIFVGWAERSSLAGGALIGTLPIDVDGGTLTGDAAVLTYPRGDLGERGSGLIGFIAAAADREPAFANVALGADTPLSLSGSDQTARRPGEEVREIARQILSATKGAVTTALGAAIERDLPAGQDTLAALDLPLWMAFDEVIAVPGTGLMLIGWMIDPTAAVRALRVRSSNGASRPLDRIVRVRRPDVKAGFEAQLALDHDEWGFHALAILDESVPGDAWLEVETEDGRIAVKPIPAPTCAGRIAVMRALNGIALAPDQVAAACGTVLAPAIIGLNRGILDGATAPAIQIEGTPHANPRCSFIVPLYGRLDFLMHQIALASEADRGIDEFVYVLDQPERRQEFLSLARSVHARFGIPLKLVLPTRNLGFAGATNAGLAAARGRYVCFLNSDVTPAPFDWAGTLIAALEADPGIGLIGARLLFEDGTLQHGGMQLERLPELGGLSFPLHPGKGRMPAPEAGVRRVPLVTGACMLLTRERAQRLGGFSTDYAIGDFEDADLCMRIRAEGLDCAVHDGVTLYHLERQSQEKAHSSWRSTLTLVNAWTFYTQWPDAVDAAPWRHAARRG